MYPLNTQKTIWNGAIHIYRLSYDLPDTVILFTVYSLQLYKSLFHFRYKLKPNRIKARALRLEYYSSYL